ncbi:MAG TPA: 50S ribosomal protein L21 [Actinomycetota bacterium]|nr:50S ribosomal protein L21 [Actinomycetota bacterium]
MYAVIKTGGKQHKVQPGDIIEVEYLQPDGDTVTFHPVLVVDDDGTTHFGKEAQRATVTAKFVGEQKGDKVQVFKYKNKSGYARRQGHRQLMTLLEISDVKLAASRKPTVKKTAAKDEDTKAADAKDEGTKTSDGAASESEQ